MIGRYTPKQIPIVAVQATKQNKDEIHAMYPSFIFMSEDYCGNCIGTLPLKLGEAIDVDNGDYIIRRTSDNKVWVVDVKSFEENYEKEVRTIKLYHTYRHFKGDKYVPIYLGMDSATFEQVVIYHSARGEKEIWVRSLEEFMSPVDRVKYPGAKQFYRFEECE